MALNIVRIWGIGAPVLQWRVTSLHLNWYVGVTTFLWRWSNKNSLNYTNTNNYSLTRIVRHVTTIEEIRCRNYRFGEPRKQHRFHNFGLLYKRRSTSQRGSRAVTICRPVHFQQSEAIYKVQWGVALTIVIVQRDNSHGDESTGAADQLHHVFMRCTRHVLAVYLKVCGAQC